MSNHYYNTNYEPTITTEQAFDPEFQSTFSDYSSAGDNSSGSGFGCNAFSWVEIKACHFSFTGYGSFCR